MESFSHGRTSQQFRFLKRQFLQDGKLPFTNVLTVETITHALETIDACWKDRIYTPLVTLWVFLGQVLSRPGKIDFTSGGWPGPLDLGR